MLSEALYFFTKWLVSKALYFLFLQSDVTGIIYLYHTHRLTFTMQQSKTDVYWCVHTTLIEEPLIQWNFSSDCVTLPHYTYITEIIFYAFSDINCSFTDTENCIYDVNRGLRSSSFIWKAFSLVSLKLLNTSWLICLLPK